MAAAVKAAYWRLFACAWEHRECSPEGLLLKIKHSLPRGGLLALTPADYFNHQPAIRGIQGLYSGLFLDDPDVAMPGPFVAGVSAVWSHRGSYTSLIRGLKAATGRRGTKLVISPTSGFVIGAQLDANQQRVSSVSVVGRRGFQVQLGWTLQAL